MGGDRWWCQTTLFYVEKLLYTFQKFSVFVIFDRNCQKLSLFADGSFRVLLLGGRRRSRNGFRSMISGPDGWYLDVGYLASMFSRVKLIIFGSSAKSGDFDQK